MFDTVRQSVINPKEALLPPNTPMTDVAVGQFSINFARAIPNPGYRAQFANQPTIICYRIHQVTNFAEVVFCPPPGKISYTLHIRDLGYEGPLSDEEIYDLQPPESHGWDMSEHIMIRRQFLNDYTSWFDRLPKPDCIKSMTSQEYDEYRAAWYGDIVNEDRVVTKPVMDQEQHIRMVETTLVSTFDYMVDILEQHPDGPALNYAARSIEDPPDGYTTACYGYLGSVVHQLACKCLLEFHWSGPIDGFDLRRKFVPPTAETGLTDYTEDAFGFMLEDPGDRVYRVPIERLAGVASAHTDEVESVDSDDEETWVDVSESEEEEEEEDDELES
ncbi:hypothetical protein GGF32_007739 [Allomyces javanicus]|nr:hypothetical protein GGF32_007739 [Allomyces javanicus]